MAMQTPRYSLDASLAPFNVEPELLKVLSAIGFAVVDIGRCLRKGTKGYGAEAVGTQNTFGDEQLAVDVTSDKAVFDQLRRCGNVMNAASEETCDREQV